MLLFQIEFIQFVANKHNPKLTTTKIIEEWGMERIYFNFNYVCDRLFTFLPLNRAYCLYLFGNFIYEYLLWLFKMTMIVNREYNQNKCASCFLKATIRILCANLTFKLNGTIYMMVKSYIYLPYQSNALLWNGKNNNHVTHCTYEIGKYGQELNGPKAKNDNIHVTNIAKEIFLIFLRTITWKKKWIIKRSTFIFIYL